MSNTLKTYYVFDSEEFKNIPNLDLQEAIALMDDMLKRNMVPMVFCDGGWEGNPEDNIDIIDDGDGQQSFARITPGAYQLMLSNGRLGRNNYGGYKSRRIHTYIGA